MFSLKEHAARLRANWLRTPRGSFILLVLLPAALVLLYTTLIGSPQYESHAEFIVRGIEPDKPQLGGLAEIVQGAAPSSAVRETVSIQNYLTSHEAIEGLRKKGIDLIDVYHKDGVDILSKLRFAKPRAETLLEYYRNHVSVDFDTGDSITRLSVRAFDPKEAQAIASSLISLGEQRINTFNKRAIEAAQTAALDDLNRAEQDLSQIQGELTRFRDLSGDIDSSAAGLASQTQLEAVESELIRREADLSTMQRQLDADSPLVVAARSRVASLRRAAGELKARMAGDAGDISRRLSAFEELKLRQEFAAKRYESARAALENAKAQASLQQLFLVPVVNPSLPEKPVAPRPVRSTLTALLALAAAYAIGWLLLAGIREHRAD